MVNIPDILILDLEHELRNFYKVIEDLSLPTPDVEAALDQIFSVIGIAEDDIYFRMLSNVAMDMGKGEGLYENARLDETEQDIIMYTVIELGKDLKKAITHLNAYTDGFFPYHYKCLLNKNTVVLKRNNEEL